MWLEKVILRAVGYIQKSWSTGRTFFMKCWSSGLHSTSVCYRYLAILSGCPPEINDRTLFFKILYTWMYDIEKLSWNCLTFPFCQITITVSQECDSRWQDRKCINSFPWNQLKTHGSENSILYGKIEHFCLANWHSIKLPFKYLCL